ATAYGVARLEPERVRFLVTLAIPHPASIPRSPFLLWKARHFVTLRRSNAVDKVRANDFAYIDELVRRWSPAWSPPADETAAVKRIFADPACVEAACGYYRAVGLTLPRALRGAIGVPTLAFAGPTDPFLGLAVSERGRRFFT